jgi:hypothetical protein
MTSPQYFDYIRNCWKLIPDKDRERMAELWKSYEQTVAAEYQKFFEVSFGTSIRQILPFNDQRWLPHTFNNSNVVVRPAMYRTTQDLSVGVNLQSKFLIKFSWDNEVPLEVDCRGLNPASTTASELRDRINVSAGFRLCQLAVNDALLQFTSPTSGPSSKISFYAPSNILLDASEFILGLTSLNLPMSLPKFPYTYKSQYPFLVSVPVLRSKIRKETEGYRSLLQGVDYSVKDGMFEFLEQPPEDILWATRNLFNEETPWNNFGFLLDIYQDNSERYVQIIQGLWFAFWTGPRPENIRKALYLLFGLPTSPFDGIVTLSIPSEVTVRSFSGEERSYEVPTDLVPIVSVGQKVTIFQPLVDGIEIFDKVNRPGFIETEIGRFGIQRFLTENATTGPGPDTDETRALRMLEEYCFLPQINVNAFISPDINLGNVKIFLENIKPLTRTYLFQVIVGTFKDELSIDDKIAQEISLDLTPNLDSNASTFAQALELSVNESLTNEGLLLDSEGVCFSDTVEIEVKSFGSTIDLFTV